MFCEFLQNKATKNKHLLQNVFIVVFCQYTQMHIQMFNCFFIFALICFLHTNQTSMAILQIKAALHNGQHYSMGFCNSEYTAE